MKKYIKDLWEVLRTPEMLILPGNIAFYVILSLAPLITLLGIITSSLSLPINNIVSFLSNVIPAEIIDILIPFIDGSGINTWNILFVFLGLFVVSNSMDSLIVASNLLYKNNNSNYFLRRVKAILLTICLLVLFIFAIIVMAFGRLILTKILTFGVIGKFISNHYAIISITKLLIAFLIIFVIIRTIYIISLDVKIKAKSVNIGALFATLFIIIVTELYSIYVNNIAHYDVLYGGLASIAILMFLIYLISYIIVMGIIINYNNMNK